MGMMRRLVPVLIGLAAGYAAARLAQRDTVAETEHHEHTKGPAASAAAAPKTVPVQAPAAAHPAVQPDRPNGNPVEAEANCSPLKKGHVDVEHIAEAKDFADWEDFGCQG